MRLSKVLQVILVMFVWIDSGYTQEHQNRDAGANNVSPSSPVENFAIPVRIVSNPNDLQNGAGQDDARDKERQWNEANLAVQRSIADSSKQIVHYTSYQIWIAIASIGFAFFTLGTAIAAAFFARRSADAANKSVDITRHFGEAQTRAYVYAKAAKMNWYNEGAQAVITIANCGTTPAKNFSLSGTIDFQPLKSRPPIPAITSGNTWSSLGANESTDAPLYAEGIHLNDLDRGQENYLSVRGTVKYTTIFDEVAFSEFSFMLKFRANDKHTMQVAAKQLRVFEIESA